MGRRKWYRCNCMSCFRAKYKVNETPLQELPKPKEADETDGLPYIDADKEADILIVRKIDPCIAANGPAHNTSKYHLMTRSVEPQLVVRRGQSFRLDIQLSRPYNDTKDGISFVFVVDDSEKPSHGQGTLVAVPLLRKPDKSLPWNVILESVSEDLLTVQVTSPSDCPVAKWKMEIDTKLVEDGAYRYSWETGIYLLFNPWNKRDQVYMKNEEWREETTLNDVGLIWRGTANRLRPTIWKYDQFEETILECSLYVLNCIGKIHGNSKSDPVQITRALAAGVNSVDDEGVVMGNWSENHSGGTPPTKWIGSAEILQKYYKKKKPVRFGQCWVFAGVVTTICRALGIPSRVVTNYSSAHDTQSSLTVDFFMDSNGKIVDDLNSDSIWTFHVWNEVWMKRPDIGEEYDGWQAIDATPQEPSEDVYRCGPASVLACKRGEVLRPYDGSFLFAEVNADKVFWRYTGPTQPLKLLGKDMLGIGKLISTKAPGKFEREDITYTYKHPEKTREERVTMLKALQQSESSFSRYYLNEDFNDIHFNFELRDDIIIGDPFTVCLVMKNRNKNKDFNVSVILRVDVMAYTGKSTEQIKKEKFDIVVKSESVHEVKLEVPYKDYFKKLKEQANFNISCLATVEDTKFEYYAQDDFRVRKPDIKIILPDNLQVDNEVIGDIELVNPLPNPLKKGEFLVDVPGSKQIKIKVKGAVLTKQSAVAQFKFTPKEIGMHTIGAKFTSKELNDVDGFVNFNVLPKEEAPPV
ncbi:annulin [Onthophagus taurus]|uniref:annulin n=1 Tax=Onthophagus taurus TaxID=166361 RepID=UPI0039BDBB34